jgi:DNA/RNA endonuclease YhcR with UshA esterase domain
MRRVAFDPLVVPDSVRIADVRVRDCVPVSGVVTELVVRSWAGGTPALHATVDDGSGSMTVAFVGRTRVAGLERGATVVVGGAVIARRGRPLIMNPQLWLRPSSELIGLPDADRSPISA